MTSSDAAKPGNPVAIFIQLATKSVMSCAVIAALAYWPVQMYFGAGASLAALAGAAIALVGGLCAAIPAARTFPQGPRAFCFGVMAGLGLRFGVTLALALVVKAAGALESSPLLISVGAFQMALLMTDTAAQVRLSSSYSAEVRCLA